MADDLVFYTHPMSRGRIVRWMLEEVGQPYRTELLQYGSTIKSAEFLAINPMGKVPAIRHGAAVVTEGAAICAYLADAFPEAGLAPPVGDPRRATYYRWLFFAAGPIEAAMINTALGVVVPPERKSMAGYGSLTDTLDAVQQAVSDGGPLDGHGFTAADLFVASQLDFGLKYRMFRDRPALAAYAARMSDRPARVRAAEIDDALIAAAPAKA